MKDLIKLFIKEYQLTEKEISFFFYNYCDAIMYNSYLREKDEYRSVKVLTPERQLELIEFFKRKGINKETAKKILISSPMILYCDNLEEQLDFVYKDATLEGIIIIDDNGKYHPYRIKNNMRSITENPFMLDKLVMSSDSDFKKVYYTKPK